MSHRRRAGTWLRVIALLAAWLVGMSLLTATTAEAAPKPPAGLKAISTASTSVALTWKPVSGAAEYRISYAKNSKFKSAKTKTTAAGSLELTGLKAKTKYWIRIRALDANGRNLTSFSKAIKVKTRSKGSYKLLAPAGLTADTTTTTTASLSWQARGTTNRYRIQLSKSAKMSKPKYYKVSGTTTTISGLEPNTTYYAKVRVLSSKSANLSQYSPSFRFTTSTVTAPDQITVVDSSATSVTLTWPEIPGAPAYRVKYDINPWESSAYATTTTNSVTLTGLTPGARYWVKARVMNASGKFLSDYGAKVAFTATLPPAPPPVQPEPTPEPVPELPPCPPPAAGGPAPTGLTATLREDLTSVQLSWDAITCAPRYRIKFDVDPWNSSQYREVTENSAVLDKLTPTLTYSFKVRLMSADGQFLTDYGSTVQVTIPAKPTPLVVASYNVRCHNCRSGLAEEQPWSVRRTEVAATIKSADPDVIGLQEAQQSWLIRPDGSTQNKSQFEDLVDLLGSPWALTNPARNNCVNSNTPTGCVYADQGASNGTKIIYRTDRLKRINSGTVQLSRLYPDSYDRYLAWAIFEQRATGKRFFFADTHLEPDNDLPGQTIYHDWRALQARDVWAAIAARNPGLEVVLAADLASSRADNPTNAPYDVLTREIGLIDPLGNVKNSTVPVNPTVESRINTNYYSFNGWARFARRTTTQLNGIYVDYILTTPMRVSEWETVVNVDPLTNTFIGVIPSDHNLIKATVWLP